MRASGKKPEARDEIEPAARRNNMFLRAVFISCGYSHITGAPRGRGG